MIKRRNQSWTNGRRDPEQVYVTGPRFGIDVYSSTTKIAEASRFTEDEARELIAIGRWRHHAPAILPVEGDLPVPVVDGS